MCYYHYTTEQIWTFFPPRKATIIPKRSLVRRSQNWPWFVSSTYWIFFIALSRKSLIFIGSCMTKVTTQVIPHKVLSNLRLLCKLESLFFPTHQKSLQSLHPFKSDKGLNFKILKKILTFFTFCQICHYIWTKIVK